MLIILGALIPSPTIPRRGAFAMIRLFSLVVLTFGTAFFGLASGSQAAIISYTAILDGPSESPPNASPGAGFTQVDIDTATDMMRVRITFSDLIGTTTASHIHSPTAAPGTGTAGVATVTPTFTGFPLGVTSGSYDHTFDLTSTSSYNPAFVTANGGTAAGAEAALLAGLAAGKAYMNVHTSAFPAGEIRGFLQPIPEPAGVVLGAVGGIGVLAARRLRRR